MCLLALHIAFFSRGSTSVRWSCIVETAETCRTFQAMVIPLNQPVAIAMHALLSPLWGAITANYLRRELGGTWEAHMPHSGQAKEG